MNELLENSTNNTQSNSLLKNIIDEYNSNKKINNDKLKLCVEIMDEYYKGVIGIGNFFNI